MAASARKQRAVLVRRECALAMLAEGHTFQQIADGILDRVPEEFRAEAGGYRTAGAAAQDTTRALRQRSSVLAGHRDVWVALEAERLDTVDRACHELLRTSGDDLVILRAADRIVRTSARRSALLGLDAGPVRGQAGSQGEPGDPASDVVDELAAARAERRRAAYR